MADCYAFAERDVCDTGRVLQVQLEAEPQTVCSTVVISVKAFHISAREIKCDYDATGMSCDELVAEAKAAFQAHADTVGSYASLHHMSHDSLECTCVDQNSK